MRKEEFQSALKKTWLLGSLVQAGPRTLGSALYEFAYLLLWSILPFALGGLVFYVAAEPADKSYLTFVVSTFKNGELLVFTISMLAPTLYLVLHDPQGATGGFPHKLPLSTIVIFVIVVSAALFSLLKAGTVKDPDSVFLLSLVFTTCGLVLRYLAMVYHRLRVPEMSERTFRADEHSFVDQMKKHVGEA